MDQTPDGVAKFAKAVTDALNLSSTNRARVFTIVATDVAQQLDAFHNDGGSGTFAEWVGWIEKEFNKIKTL